MKNETKDSTARARRRRAPGAPRKRSRRLARLLRRARAGMTIIEIMVVVIIMGLIMSAAGIAIFNQLKRAKISTTNTAINNIRSAIGMYRSDPAHSSECPTVDQLRGAGLLDRNTMANDAWGHPYHVDCSGEEIAVTSDGPDGRQGSSDDLPPNQGNSGNSSGNNNN